MTFRSNRVTLCRKFAAFLESGNEFSICDSEEYQVMKDCAKTQHVLGLAYPPVIFRFVTPAANFGVLVHECSAPKLPRVLQTPSQAISLPHILYRITPQVSLYSHR